MKKFLTFFLLMVVLCAVLPCYAQVQEVDPILIDKPNRWVYECTDELVLELMVQPVIDYYFGGKDAKDYFLFLTVEFLYLQDWWWNGLDKNSFELKYRDQDGNERMYQLNYMMTAMMSMKNGWHTMADWLSFPTLMQLQLVFDVDTMEHKDWTLIFHPAERGHEPVCEVEIPLVYRWW